jgi:hypothetical protein
MSRSQFRFLVVINQLLFLMGYFIQPMTDETLPPELRSFGSGQSVFETQASGFDFFDWWGPLLLVAGVIGAIGLCFGKRWGRTLFLLTAAAAAVGTLFGGFYVDTGWTVFVGSIAGITEGMILGIAYFSHVRRMFETGLHDDQD